MATRIIALSFLLLACGAPPADQELRAITDAKTILAIYYQDWRLTSSGELNIIVAAWDDGRILWSDDRLRGGPPYRGAQIGASRLTELLSRFDEDSLFDIDVLSHPHFGPDTEFTTIVLNSSGKQLKMESSHELVEEKGGIVREYGTVFSDKRPRFEVLREEPNDYLFYRFVWAEIRARALSLIPTCGDTIHGEVVVTKPGVISWQNRNEPQH